MKLDRAYGELFAAARSQVEASQPLLGALDAFRAPGPRRGLRRTPSAETLLSGDLRGNAAADVERATTLLAEATASAKNYAAAATATTDAREQLASSLHEAGVSTREREQALAHLDGFAGSELLSYHQLEHSGPLRKSAVKRAWFADSGRVPPERRSFDTKGPVIGRHRRQLGGLATVHVPATWQRLKGDPMLDVPQGGRLWWKTIPPLDEVFATWMRHASSNLHGTAESATSIGMWDAPTPLVALARDHVRTNIVDSTVRLRRALEANLGTQALDIASNRDEGFALLAGRMTDYEHALATSALEASRIDRTNWAGAFAGETR